MPVRYSLFEVPQATVLLLIHGISLGRDVFRLGGSFLQFDPVNEKMMFNMDLEFD